MAEVYAFLPEQCIGYRDESTDYGLLAVMIRATLVTSEVGQAPLCSRGLGGCALRVNITDSPRGVDVAAYCGQADCSAAVLVGVRRCIQALGTSVRAYTGEDAIQQFVDKKEETTGR